MRAAFLIAFALGVCGCESASVAGSVVVYGDSFSAGAGSDLRAPELWPTKLGTLLGPRGGADVSNRSINGNGLVWKTRCFGEPALERVQADLSSLPPDAVIILMAGVNDTIQPNLPAGFSSCFDPAPWSSAKLTDRLQALAGSRGSRRILLATIPPFAASEFHSAEAETIRRETNLWIRTHWPKGDLIDLDRVLAAPDNPLQLRKSYDSGDGLHPNEQGAAAIAAAVAEMLK